MAKATTSARSLLWPAKAALVGLAMCGAARAADLDYPYPRAVPAAPYPGCLPVPPGCRTVPQPEMNLYNEVTRAGIQRICVSRGVYADSFYPYAPPYWRPNHRQGYGPESDWPW